MKNILKATKAEVAYRIKKQGLSENVDRLFLFVQKKIKEGRSRMRQEIKIFQLNDCEWYAATDIESAIKVAMSDRGQSREDCVEDLAHELTDEELDTLRFIEDQENDEDAEDNAISFRERLDLMIERGDSFPCAFATTEF